MEREDLFPCSEELASGPHYEAKESTLHLRIRLYLDEPKRCPLVYSAVCTLWVLRYHYEGT
jgi:hypothetical protein